MKGFVKMIIAGGIIIGIGLVIMLVFLGLNGWNMNGKFDMKTYESVEPIHSLKVEFSAGTLVTEYVDGDTITVEYPENDSFKTTCTLADGVLSITNGRQHWYNFIWFGTVPTTTLKIPKGMKIDLDVHLNAGAAIIEGADYENIKLRLNAGTVELGNSTCADFTCEMNAGTVSTKSLECNKFYVKLNAGAFDNQSLLCPDIEARLNAGSVSTSIVGDKSEYNIAVDKNAGSCSVSSAVGTTDKKLYVKINAGSFDAEFKN